MFIECEEQPIAHAHEFAVRGKHHRFRARVQHALVQILIAVGHANHHLYTQLCNALTHHLLRGLPFHESDHSAQFQGRKIGDNRLRNVGQHNQHPCTMFNTLLAHAFRKSVGKFI